MTGARIFRPLEIVVAFLFAACVQVGILALLTLGDPKIVHAEISDENSRPIAVAITPELDLPAGQLLGPGGKKNNEPSMWKRKAPTKHSALPSTKADPTLAGSTTAKVEADAGPPTDASSDVVELPFEGGTGGDASGPFGFPDGGAPPDEEKARAIVIYRGQLAAWFSSRFDIKGKVPFEKLEKLRATVVFDIAADRTVTGFDVVKWSHDNVFDDRILHNMASVVAGKTAVPPPPDKYPEILTPKVTVQFSCTVRSQCE